MKKMKLTHDNSIRSVELDIQNLRTTSNEEADFNEVRVLLIQGEGGDIAPYAEILNRVGITGG